MTVSFKQFSTFVKRTEGEVTQAQIDEAWSDIFRKKKEEADDEEDKDKPKVLSAKDKLKKAAEDKKKKEEERKKELQKKRDEAWQRAKDHAEGRKPSTPFGRRDDYALHKMHEGKETYADFAVWKKAAKKLKLSDKDKQFLAKHSTPDGKYSGTSNLADTSGKIVARWNTKTQKGWILSEALQEGKQSYSDEGYWKDDAKEAGFKIKKLSGNLENGDQTWGAFDGDKKMGEFTEKEDGRGGWLITE